MITHHDPSVWRRPADESPRVLGAALDQQLRARLAVRKDDIPPYRGYAGNRQTVAKFLGEMGLMVGAEVGVYTGDFSEMLCTESPGIALLCVDSWETYWNGVRVLLPGEEGEAVYQQAVRRLSPWGVELLRLPSEEAVKRVPLQSLDFVVIDADHEFDPTMLDLIQWSRRVRPGGLVMIHDFEVAYRVGTIPAVQAYVSGHGIREWYVTRDRVPYALWVKPC